MKNKSIEPLKRIPAHLVNNLIVATSLFALGVSCAPEPTAEIAVMGDSVTWGYGALPEGWAIRLENRTGYKFAYLFITGVKSCD
jgi:hypothetical protein